MGIFQALPQGKGDPGGPYPIVTPVGGEAVVTWDWARAVPVAQVSLGLVTAPSGHVRRVSVELRTTSGAWEDVAAAPGAVGDGGVVPFLLVHTAPRTATAMRVVVDTDSDRPVYVLDAHALGRQ